MSCSQVAVSIQNAAHSASVPAAAAIRRWVRAALGAEARGELTVRIVDEAESAALNGRYRDERGATNVLAFPAGPVGGVADIPIGDLVICAAVVAREAAEQCKPLDAHWAHMVVHGSLHLLGYEHASARAARVMEDRERELLGTLGIADPYEARA